MHLTPIVQLPLSRIIHIHYIERNTSCQRVARSPYEINCAFLERDIFVCFFFFLFLTHSRSRTPRRISFLYRRVFSRHHFPRRGTTIGGRLSMEYPTRRRLDRGIKKKVLRAGCLAQLRPPRAANCLLPGLITSLCYSVNARRKPLCLPRLNSRRVYTSTHTPFERTVVTTRERARDRTRARGRKSRPKPGKTHADLFSSTKLTSSPREMSALRSGRRREWKSAIRAWD